MAAPAPKTFISYSWSSPGHCDLIRSYAERLRSDGIDVILDQWDLSEGQDKYHFMEKMVTDPSVTHVLIFSDQKYAEKADARKAGVGTESQIMSKEVYEKVDQKKFIPVVCERTADEEPYLPTFFHPRIWIDFSTPERVNENWEQLIRAICGKPVHTKPALGSLPSYILKEENIPLLPTLGKFAALREAITKSKPTIPLCRQDYLDAIFKYLDSLRVRSAPDAEYPDEKILEDIRSLLPLRDQLIDWLLMEVATADDSVTEGILIEFLERLLAMKYRPADLRSWNDAWFDAHALFGYEVFLYVIGILLRLGKYALTRVILKSSYLLPESEASGKNAFESFDAFYAYSETLHQRNERLKLRRISPVADLIKERSTRSDITFKDIMQADLVLFLTAAIWESRWFPVTLIYSGFNPRFPLFIRATQRRNFNNLKLLFGISSAGELRQKFEEGYKRLGVARWHELTVHSHVSFEKAINAEALDTIE